MSADAEGGDDGANAPEKVTPYTVLMDAINEANRLDVPAGPDRAAWVLCRYRDRMPGSGQVVFGSPYTAGSYRCDECEKEPDDVPGVRVLLPSHDAPKGGGAAVLAGPFCPACAVRLLNEALR